MLEQMSGWGVGVFLYGLGIPALVILLQIAFRLWIRKVNIVVGKHTLQMNGLFRTKEISIDGVVKITRLFDMHMLKYDLRLQYYADTRARTVSGWLMSGLKMEALERYILECNQQFKTTQDIVFRA